MQQELISTWHSSIRNHPSTATDVPSYWSSDPSILRSTSTLSSFVVGTGSSLYTNLRPLLESTEHELILVTCFWARSETLCSLCTILRNLSNKALSRDTTIRVRLCFSSLSLFQKLFHTRSLDGHVYSPDVWSTRLGLPDQHELRGLDLQIKSTFVLPFSVMHPKFMIMDRQTVVLPSCNVSWEDWFEGAVVMNGEVVGHFFRFWESFWVRSREMGMGMNGCEDPDPVAEMQYRTNQDSTADTLLPKQVDLGPSDVQTVFLPSPHHVNPYFRPFPWQNTATPPRTPLNEFLLAVMRKAQKNIYIQTPNLTAPPVLSALLQTLRRGVDVRILTSERLMILEQLVTAGTTTSRCVNRLIKRYQAEKQISTDPSSRDRLLEEGEGVDIGRLKIEYYQPRSNHVESRGRACAEPVQSHLKLTIADDELVILGSGNLDRASWYTSQELGVAFFSSELASTVQQTLGHALATRKRTVFDSSTP